MNKRKFYLKLVLFVLSNSKYNVNGLHCREWVFPTPNSFAINLHALLLFDTSNTRIFSFNVNTFCFDILISAFKLIYMYISYSIMVHREINKTPRLKTK